jgi:hypothetical protein
MIKQVVISAILCGVCTLASADVSLTLGKAISQSDNVDIQLTPEETCPPDWICLRGWSRWTLDIKQTIVGPTVKGRTYVVMMQHAPVVDSTFQRQLLFVLEHIDDPAERTRLHADYKLLDITDPEAMICTSTDPARLGVSPEDIYRQENGEDVTFCFRDPRRKRD